jgi:hypothetical protein
MTLNLLTRIFLGSVAPPSFCHLTGTVVPNEEAQSTSIESPGFKYDLEGSSLRKGNRSRAM